MTIPFIFPGWSSILMNPSEPLLGKFFDTVQPLASADWKPPTATPDK